MARAAVNDPHPTGVTSTLYEIAVIGGLVLAGLIKVLFRCSWRRLTVPRRRHLHFGTPSMLVVNSRHAVHGP